MLARTGVIAGTYNSIVYDVDAQALFTAAGITNITVKTAVNTLIISAKANGWWTLYNAIYGMAGDGVNQTYASQYKYNWKDPRNLDAAFRLNFQGGWSFAATGATPDGTGYADTFIIPSVTLSANSTSIGFYSRTNSAADVFDIGMLQVSSLNPRLLFALRTGGGDYNGDQYDTGLGNRITVTGIGSSLGLFLDSRDSIILHNAYRNGSQIGVTDTSVAGSIPTTYSLYLGAANNAGSASFKSTRECAFAVIGASTNSTIAAAMYTDIQTYQTSLSRQV